MAVVVCRAPHPVDLDSGRVLQPGEQENIDLANDHDAALVYEGFLRVIDGTTVPPAPAPPHPVFVKGTSIPQPGYVPIGLGPDQVPEWGPVSLEGLVFDLVSPETFEAHEALSEGVHGLPDADPGEAIRRNGADDGWEAFDPATQAELDAAAAYADSHVRGKLIPTPDAAQDGFGLRYDHGTAAMVWVAQASQAALDAHAGLTTSAHGGIVASGDARLSDQRTPLDGSVTAAKFAASALGTGSTQAAAGNDSRFPTAGQKNALAGTAGTPGTGNEFVTTTDARLPTTGEKATFGFIPTTGQKDALAGSSGTPGSGNKFVTDADARLTNARTPTSHHASHEPGGSDALALTNLLRFGTLAARPAASASLEGIYYFASDVNGGTQYQVQSGAWVQTTKGISAQPVGAAGGDLGGSFPNPTVQQASGTLALQALTGLAFVGDIDTAKWVARTGGYKLNFLSDSADTTSLGGTTTYSGRTYREKFALNPDGSIDVAGDVRASGKASVGATSPTSDTVTSRLFIKPSADDENAITVKRPSATWGAGAAYGKGQTFELLKHAVHTNDIGYSGITPDDFVLARMDAWGAVGLCANLHLATGLRADAGYAPVYAFKIEPFVDTQFLALQGNGITQTANFINARTPAGTAVFALTPTGNVTAGLNSSGKGAFVGDIGLGGSSYFGIAHSDRASVGNYALVQGTNGDTWLNAASGQNINLAVAGAGLVQMDSTGMLFANRKARIAAGAAADNVFVVASKASQTGDLIELQTNTGTVLYRFDKNGYPINKKTAAPADGDLSAGELAIWFDQTNGAAKLMVKAKQADGTVRTGSLALA